MGLVWVSVQVQRIGFEGLVTHVWEKVMREGCRCGVELVEDQGAVEVKWSVWRLHSHVHWPWFDSYVCVVCRRGIASLQTGKVCGNYLAL